MKNLRRFKRSPYRSLFSFFFIPLLSVFLSSSVMAFPFSKEQDREKIRSLQGCFEVTYQFKETFALKADYQFHKPYSSRALEWVELDEEEEDKVVLQHLLITPHMIIKHWRQDWVFENHDLYRYTPHNEWTYEELSAEWVPGTWTQKVYQVDDSPRYECAAPWIHTTQKSYWQCETTAPLPRREFTTRSDYNLLLRRNRHELTSYGALHEEDNTKINQTAEGTTPLVLEKGLNVYKRVDNSRCLKAQEWWKEHRRFWKDVQAVWNEVFTEKKDLKLKDKNEAGQTLWEELFALDEEVHQPTHSYNQVEVTNKVRDLIKKFRIH